MYGSVPRHPVNIRFDIVLHSDSVVNYNDYVASLKRDFREAIRIAQANMMEAQEKQMRDYNHKVKGIALEIGEEVRISNYKERTKGKPADL